MTNALLIIIIVIMLLWWLSGSRYWHTITVYLSRAWARFLSLFK